MLAAMELHGIDRIVVLSAVPVGPAEGHPAAQRLVVLPLLRRLFGATYEDMTRMKDLLAAAAHTRSRCDRLGWCVGPPKGATDCGWTDRFGVARREAWRQLREERRALSLDAPVTVDSPEGGPVRAGPLVDLLASRQSVEAAHSARAALRAVAGLPQQQRRCLALRIAGYSYREIGALTGASYNGVNKALTRARARVRLS